jgi:hypothetical protein
MLGVPQPPRLALEAQVGEAQGTTRWLPGQRANKLRRAQPGERTAPIGGCSAGEVLELGGEDVPGDVLVLAVQVRRAGLGSAALSAWAALAAQAPVSPPSSTSVGAVIEATTQQLTLV